MGFVYICISKSVFLSKAIICVQHSFDSFEFDINVLKMKEKVMYLNIEFKDEEILAALEDVKKLACELERKVAFLSGRINLEASVQEEKDCR